MSEKDDDDRDSIVISPLVEITINGVYLGRCASREIAFHGVLLRLKDPEGAPPKYPHDDLFKITANEAVVIYEKIARLKVEGWPDSLRRFVVLSEILSEEGVPDSDIGFMYGMSGEPIEATFCFSKAAGRERVEEQRKLEQKEVEYDSLSEDERRLLAYIDAIYHQILAQVSSSPLPPEKTAKDLRTEMAEREIKNLELERHIFSTLLRKKEDLPN